MLLPKLPLPALQAEHAHPAHAVGLHAPLVIGVLVLARLPLALGAAEGLVRLVGHAERLRGGATITCTRARSLPGEFRLLTAAALGVTQ